MVVERWNKKKINGKIAKIKKIDEGNYLQLFIFNKITKKFDLIFVFVEEVKNFVVALDLKKHYSFFCVDKKSKKNNKVYNELFGVDDIKQMSPLEVNLYNIFTLSKTIKDEHRGTWYEDMQRVDKIYKECEEAIKNWEESKSKKYWEAGAEKEEIEDLSVF